MEEEVKEAKRVVEGSGTSCEMKLLSERNLIQIEVPWNPNARSFPLHRKLDQGTCWFGKT